MRCSTISAAVLALASSVVAQTANFAALTVPAQDQNVAAGSVLDITWQGQSGHPGPITIQLLQGATPATLEVGLTVAAGIDQAAGKFSWTVPADLPAFATYGFKLTLDSSASTANPIFQFSFPFHVTGLSSAPGSYPVVSSTQQYATLVAAPPTTVPGAGYPVQTPPAGYAANPPPAADYPANTPPAGYPVATPSADYPAHTPPAGYAVNTPSYPANTPPAGYPVHSPEVPIYHASNTSTAPYPTGTGVGPQKSGYVVTGAAAQMVSGGLAAFAGVVVALVL